MEIKESAIPVNDDVRAACGMSAGQFQPVRELITLDVPAPVEASGYRFERVQPVDMFPHTAHVETVVVLARDGRAPRV